MQIFQRRARPSSHFVARENDDEIRLIIMGLAEKKIVIYMCVFYESYLEVVFFFLDYIYVS